MDVGASSHWTSIKMVTDFQRNSGWTEIYDYANINSTGRAVFFCFVLFLSVFLFVFLVFCLYFFFVLFVLFVCFVSFLFVWVFCFVLFVFIFSLFLVCLFCCFLVGFVYLFIYLFFLYFVLFVWVFCFLLYFIYLFIYFHELYWRWYQKTTLCISAHIGIPDDISKWCLQCTDRILWRQHIEKWSKKSTTAK